MSKNNIIQALGDVAALGDLYDARTKNLLNTVLIGKTGTGKAPLVNYMLEGGQTTEKPIQVLEKSHVFIEDRLEDLETTANKVLFEVQRPLKETNIVILGETGVGKSTFINSFCNYLKYYNLEEAEKNELFCLIPSQFTMYDENYEDIVVSTGIDTNEIHTLGQSATKQSKIYAFVIGDTKIRLIDTPGYGSTRGFEQDEINFQNILMTLSYLDELHGICFLLNPNYSRINVTFNFYINELLTHLNKDASKNIMFCFTNSRGTSFGPGDTLPMLKKILSLKKHAIPISKDNLYFFDNEGHRYLACVNNKTIPITFSDIQRKMFAESWKKSVTETKRMMQHIAFLKPHSLKDTISLNDTRNNIQKLTRPIVEIFKNIQLYRRFLKYCINEIEKTEAKIKVLEKEKTFMKVGLELAYPIDYSKFVCPYTSFEIKYNNVKSCYTTICDLCYTFHKENKINEFSIVSDWNLSYIFKEICKLHIPEYKEHVIIYNETKEVQKEYEEMDAIKMLNGQLSEADEKQVLIILIKKETTELDEELKYIEDSSIKIAHFLNLNSITPYKDEVLDYINILIENEAHKVKKGESDNLMKILKISKDSYTKNVDILNEEIQKSNSFFEITIGEINSIVEKLCKLKHSGNHFKTCLNAETLIQKKNAAYQEAVVEIKVNENCHNFTDWLSIQ